MKRLLAAAILTVAVVGTVAGCGGKDIGRDAALEAALNDAGVSESDTTRLRKTETMDRRYMRSVSMWIIPDMNTRLRQRMDRS